ncbi:uncharacterized protein LOC133814668 [Humulus lupulus]|uniref:uncharacterized protein LOC133814668 n=1 Tax=Humulus lupulus TaxID=3486 RepID=UPI002B402D1B|nr:uncharacterized protein LOC133814668 [Humulus lupulus]
MALMAKFLWAISSKQDCLWVRWINSIYLKEQIIWNTPIKQEMSWYFKKLLRLRQVTDEASLRQAEKGGFNSHLLTRDHLSRFMPIPTTLCLVCVSENETHSHLFMNCIFSRKIFGEISSWMGVFQWPNSFLELQQWCLTAVSDLKNQIINAVISATMYFVWKNRNKCIYESVCSTARSISLEIRKVVKCRILGLGLHKLSKRDRYLLNVVEGW